MDRNTIVKNALHANKQNRAKFEDVSEEESRCIEIQKQEMEKDIERYRMKRDYIFKLIAWEQRKSEIDDLVYTVKTMQTENQTHWKAHDQYISLNTMQARLNQCIVGLHSFQKELHTLKRQVFEGYKCTNQEVEEAFNALTGRDKQPKQEEVVAVDAPIKVESEVTQ